MDKDSRLREIFRQIIHPLVAPAFTVTPLCYVGAIAGSEFITFDANKLYLCHQFESAQTGTIGSVLGMVTFYNELNAAFFNLRDGNAIYDASVPAVRLHTVSAKTENLYFSRIETAVYNYMRFLGYRINIA